MRQRDYCHEEISKVIVNVDSMNPFTTIHLAGKMIDWSNFGNAM